MCLDEGTENCLVLDWTKKPSGTYDSIALNVRQILINDPDFMKIVLKWCGMSTHLIPCYFHATFNIPILYHNYFTNTMIAEVLLVLFCNVHSYIEILVIFNELFLPNSLEWASFEYCALVGLHKNTRRLYFSSIITELRNFYLINITNQYRI